MGAICIMFDMVNIKMLTMANQINKKSNYNNPGSCGLHTPVLDM